MSTPSTNGLRRDDFWELTNFGDQAINLSTYWFRDEGGFSGAANLATLWAGTRTDSPVIGPNESIIFAKIRTGAITTPADFTDWWGNSRLLPNLKIIFYSGYGFDSVSDTVQLWRVDGGRINLLQRVELFESLMGRSFTYNPTTGVLSEFSEPGIGGAFMALSTDDVGSPGITTGSVPLALESGPENAEVDGGSPVTLQVRAHGLPAPQYQWLFNDAPIAGATSRTFTIAAASTFDVGQYTVEISNGLTDILTPSATVAVNTNSSPARIVSAPSDIEVTPGQTACFTVETRGYPLPTFQWQYKGVAIPGATSSTYCVTGVSESQTGLYSVHVTNPLRSTNASARLTMVPVARVIITEAMSSTPNSSLTGHNSWWELTNNGTNTVNLRGYRWDDNPPSPVGSVTVMNDVLLAPSQSAIFVSSMTPEDFRRWWGEENLPAGLPILSHPGNGLSPAGDSVTLWNATARDVNDYIFSYGVLDQSDPPTQDKSLLCDPDFADCVTPSVEGENGAFRSADGIDVGSPGWTSNEQKAAPRYVSIRRENAGYTLRWKTEPNRTYLVQSSDSLNNPQWTTLASLLAVESWLSTTDPVYPVITQRYYRVLLKPTSQ